MLGSLSIKSMEIRFLSFPIDYRIVFKMLQAFLLAGSCYWLKFYCSISRKDASSFPKLIFITHYRSKFEVLINKVYALLIIFPSSLFSFVEEKLFHQLVHSFF